MMRTTTSATLLAVAVLMAGCVVPDKFFSDAGAGDDTGDGGVDVDGDIADVTAPETTIDSAPVALSNDATPTFEFSADEPATFLCSVDGAAPEACTSALSPTLADGPHTFSVAAVDTVGNQDETPAEHTWSMDTVAPETTITMGPPPADNSATVMLSFTSNEADVTFACTYDGATAACTSPASYAAGNGNHTFSVRATDPSGNVGAPATHPPWTTDLSTPDTTIDSGPAASSSVSSTTAIFAFSSPNAGVGATFACSLDGAAFVGCSSPRTLNGLTEVSHTFAVRVTNQAGTTDPSPASRTWTVDVTAPNTTIATGPAAGTTVQSTSAPFTFTSNEAGATFECALDGPTFSACPASHTLSGLAQGAHTLQVHAIDLALNVDASPASRSWTVDTVGPTVTIVAPSPAAGSTSGPRVTFAFTASEGTPQCRFDSDPFGPCTSPVSASLNAGSHRFDVRSSDTIGNVTTTSRTWTVACSLTAFGTTGIILFHFDEPGTAEANQTVINEINTNLNTTLGGSATVDSVTDPVRINNGRFNRALQYQAADRDMVRWTDAPAPAPRTVHDHSIELWVRPGSTASKNVVVGMDEVALSFTSTAAGVRFSYEIAILGTPTVTISSGPVVAGTWNHVVATYTGSTMQLYLNGALVDTDTITLVGQPFALSTIFVGTAGTVEGDLDEVFIGGQAMTANDVLNRYCPL